MFFRIIRLHQGQAWKCQKWLNGSFIDGHFNVYNIYNTQQRQQCVHWDRGKKPKSYFVRSLNRSCRGSVSSRDQLWWFNGRNHTHWRSSPNSWKLRRWLLHADCSDRLNTSMETRTQQSAPGLSAPLASRMFTTISPIPEQIAWVSERVEISHLHLWLIQVLKVHPMDRTQKCWPSMWPSHFCSTFKFYNIEFLCCAIVHPRSAQLRSWINAGPILTSMLWPSLSW